MPTLFAGGWSAGVCLWSAAEEAAGGPTSVVSVIFYTSVVETLAVFITGMCKHTVWPRGYTVSRQSEGHMQRWVSGVLSSVGPCRPNTLIRRCNPTALLKCGLVSWDFLEPLSPACHPGRGLHKGLCHRDAPWALSHSLGRVVGRTGDRADDPDACGH